MRHDIITDILQIEALAKERHDENWRFRSYIKGWLDWPDARLDAFVREVYEGVTRDIDCLSCAHCCRVMRIEMDPEDIERLAGRLGMSAAEFEERYTEPDDDGARRIAAVPCPFLEGNACSVYEDRPHDCMEFPHLDKENFRFRCVGAIENTAYCPLVFNTLERLKERLPYHRRRRERHL
jgi:Fe-S-cluster containining protein